MRLSTVVIIIGAAAVFTTAALLYPRPYMDGQVSKNIIKIKDAEVAIEIADTPALREKGLSGREELGENEGMLFVFDSSSPRSFWMKDMHFPIDIIWIGEDKKVAGVSANISPNTFPQSFSSPVPVPYVLEVSAGWTERHGITPGDQMTAPVVK